MIWILSIDSNVLIEFNEKNSLSKFKFGLGLEEKILNSDWKNIFEFEFGSKIIDEFKYTLIFSIRFKAWFQDKEKLFILVYKYP